MGSVAQLHDPEGDRLIRLAESLGGAENLSEGERWRLANTLDRRRKLEARATQPDGRTDALSSQVVERRFAAIETQAQWADGMLKEVLPQVVGEVIAEAEERSGAEAKKLLNELRIETDQKLNAQFAGFETAVSELRNEDRAAHNCPRDAGRRGEPDRRASREGPGEDLGALRTRGCACSRRTPEHHRGKEIRRLY
jgi:hypothetical protein